MYVRSHVHSEMELIRWFALVILAAALALLVASQASGGNHPLRDSGVPGLLPTQIDHWARPLPQTEGSVPVTQDSALQMENSGSTYHFTTVERVWNALEAHRAGDPVAALEAWEAVHLPRSSQVWQQVAMSMAYLQCHMPDNAARSLAIARSIDSENPVVLYMLGILRLDQAEEALEWRDAVHPAYIRLAAQFPHEIAPNTRSMYELAAIQAFERATERAHHLRLDLPLVSADWMTPENGDSFMPLEAPCVGDLLEAIGAERFLGKSHWVLGEMYVERGALDHAEEHLDAARAEQIATGIPFRKLARAYEGAGRHSDAARAYMKAMSPEAGVVGPAEKALENFRKALWGSW